MPCGGASRRPPPVRGAALVGMLVATFEATTVIVLRAHYTMDVFTGVVVALLVGAYADRWSRPINPRLARLAASPSPVTGSETE